MEAPETGQQDNEALQEFDAITGGQQDNEALNGFDAIAWQIEQEYAAKMDGIIDMHASSLDPNLAISIRDTEHLHIPEPEVLEEDSSDDDDPTPTTTKPTASQQFAEIEARARAQDDTGRRLRSGSVHAKSTTTADLHEQARSARSFARALTERERRYERAFHAGAFHASPAPDADADAKNVQQAISHLREERKRRQRYVVDIKTGEQIDVITDGYYDLGANDLTPDGRIETASST